MFIKITKNRKGQGYYHLVESYRDQGKTKQRTLLSLGKVGEDGLEKLISAIGKYKDVLTAVEAAKALDIEDTYVLGPLLAVQHMFHLFGIDRLLREIAAKHPQMEFDLCQTIF